MRTEMEMEKGGKLKWEDRNGIRLDWIWLGFLLSLVFFLGFSLILSSLLFSHLNNDDRS